MRIFPTLETERLIIRPFIMDDLADAHRMFDKEIYPPGMNLEERREWLEWNVRNPHQLALLGQPPYGDRAVALKTGELVGSVGVVPYLADFSGIPFFDRLGISGGAAAEVGLFWAVAPDHQRKGYATEAARALIDWLFEHEHLGRIIAETGSKNIASQGVMHKLGMHVEKNSLPNPKYIHVLGILENKP